MHLSQAAVRAVVVPILLGAMVLSCGGDGPTDPPVPVATKLAFVTAPPSSASADEVLTPQPVIQLQDATGTAVPKAGVVVTASLEGGSVTGATATTASNGRATFTGLALNATVGSRTLRFDAPSLTGLTHSVTLTAGASSSIAPHSAANQAGFAGLPVEQPPSVKVSDAAGNPSAGVAVTFEVVGGGGSLTGATGVTGADGVATVGGWILGSVPGANAMSARAEGVSGSVTFTATSILAGDASTLPAAVQVGLVGQPIDSVPLVTVRKDGNPRPGVTVTFRVVTGGGSIAVAEVLTDYDGIATAGAWTLGSAPGENVVEADVPGYAVAPFRFRAWGVASLPASVAVHAGDGQVVDAGVPVPIAPAVRATDAGGAPLIGFPVTFEAGHSNGTVTGGSAVTDAQGVATVGSWQPPLSNGTFQLVALAQPLEAPLPGSLVVFSATVVDDTPGLIQKTGGQVWGEVGQAVDEKPRVRVTTSGGTPLENVAVQFAVEPGSGSIAGVDQVTDVNGEATLGSWTLGTTAGPQRVTATAGSASLAVVVEARPGLPASAIVVEGDGQAGLTFNPLAVAPRVRLLDQYGNPSPGTSVQWGVSSGGGVVVAALGTTDAAGEAWARWVLGGSVGQQQLKAEFSFAVAPIYFSASGQAVSSPFDIEVIYATPPTAEQQAAVNFAVGRWRAIIQNDLPPWLVNLEAGACDENQPAINRTVDDLLLVVDFSYIDGYNGILGSAGPCVLRGTSQLPAFGTIAIDEADAATLVSRGELRDVMIHELGHVLGIGTVWIRKLLLAGATSGDPRYIGSAGISGYRAMGGTDPSVAVEAGGGAGTALSHWRESTFDSELMTGYIGGTNNPLTRMTARSLTDLGYVVDDATADPLGFIPSLRRDAQAARARVPVRQLRERPLTGPIIVSYPDGTTRKVPR
ncbi:MAG TPA: leishmanolysin-related zinc metalloendopeptidase [Gemmatimonadales bacterium]|nr:leishmanolysin-related zinc metalloendopeptidase [Gemmatimonadales bacterium]